MKKIKLSAEEREAMKAIERDEFVPVSGKELREVAETIANRKKDASLTIRVNSREINLIKKMADKRGIPYQSYLSEVMHRAAQAL